MDCLGVDVVKFDAEVGDAPYEFGDEIDNPKDATSKTARDRQIRLVLENEVSE
ncbi:MAG TPA: hypothetical protein VFF30_05230 [Nitrososphaerales archaeon]|nr:hypothetical protein [Nitrososphaerales archaeon]